MQKDRCFGLLIETVEWKIMLTLPISQLFFVQLSDVDEDQEAFICDLTISQEESLY